MKVRITPTLEEERTDKRMYQMFFTWFAANVNILTLVCLLRTLAIFMFTLLMSLSTTGSVLALLDRLSLV